MSAATPYEEARRSARDALREMVVAAAVEILEAEGPAGLSVRRVAARIGSSTKVLYTTFGDKGGLVDALFVEGFDRLTARLQAAPRRRDPDARLAEIGRAYLAFAREHATFFEIMYGAPVAEFFPSKQSREMARASFEVLLDAVRHAQKHAALPPGDPVPLGRALWSAMHGPTQLHVHGWLEREEAEEQLDLLIAAAVRRLGAG